ncbi:MAG TPA: YdeI/OmpD-associated family protein [Vicinamibacterales bacterium]|nr:YdeI/OmpD-associated family protein [Vicinamibacterales bacterium]
MKSDVKPRFFTTPEKLRAWFERNHRTATELWVGFYRTNSGRKSVTWSEAVDQALCFGWIDGIRKSIDEISYTNRFTPRKPHSNWSAVNIARMKALIAKGLVAPAGLEAFKRRSAARSGVYSYEQRHSLALDPAREARLRANAAAWTYFQSEAPYYRRLAVYWVMSAKKDETRDKRLERLIADSEAGRRIGTMGASKRGGRTAIS